MEKRAVCRNEKLLLRNVQNGYRDTTGLRDHKAHESNCNEEAPIIYCGFCHVCGLSFYE